ncbi:hypothetical protein KUCAC02_017762 [Chaenocephalus aceratus]|uniref:Uncharacterized protein n=1 Tax=Chaenocephalus aceratus TaxID=36190 RepID=A0ACB9W3X7_CHAAC|nr:hypothetical protein KUCAC02_017762 [Chaenocephalus aceratus]
MGAVLSWFAARLFALVLHTADALRRWRPQEALEHSPHPSEGLGLEEGDLGADSQEWCNRGTGGGDTSDEYCDSRSRHSDTLSDLSPDGEDSVDALLGLEGACLSRRATVSTFRTGQRKARRREVVTAKEERRDAQTRLMLDDLDVAGGKAQRTTWNLIFPRSSDLQTCVIRIQRN